MIRRSPACREHLKRLVTVMKSSISRPTDSTLLFAMNLSLAVGVLLVIIKGAAYWLTNSAAILGDTAESIVHLAAIIFASISVRLAMRPADEDHLYGHAKITFFSAGFEGAMIILAAIYIIHESVSKWLVGVAPGNLGIGTLLIFVTGAINGVLGLYLVWLGRKSASLIVEAHGKHVLTDCWTSLGVLTGLILVGITGWSMFDPLCGILVACNILYSGWSLLKSAIGGLMDRADPEAHQTLVKILDKETDARGLHYHELRHRNTGDMHLVELHLLFPEGVLLREAHRTATAIELAVGVGLNSRARVTTHLECAADHAHSHELTSNAPKQKSRKPEFELDP